VTVHLLFAAAQAAAPDCEALLRVQPGSQVAVTCLSDRARATGDYAAALTTAEALSVAHPDWAWVDFTLADLRSDQGQVDEAMASYRRALTRFDADGELQGQVLGRLNLVTYLAGDRQFPEARALLDEAFTLAGADGALHARARAQRARVAWVEGRDLEQAQEDLRALLEELGTTDEHQTKLVALHTLFGIADHTGQIDLAGWWLDQLQAHADARGDRYVLATVAAERLRLTMELPITDEGRVRDLALDAVRLGEAGSNPFAAMEGRCAFAWGEPWPASAPAWDRCLRDLDADGAPERAAAWRIWKFDRTLGADPAVAEAALVEAEALVADRALAQHRPLVVSRRVQLAVASGRSAEAWRTTEVLLDLVRDLATTSDPASRGALPEQQVDLLYEPAAYQAQLPDGVDRSLRVTETLRGALLGQPLVHQPIPTLAEVQALLRPDEAVWSFQLPRARGPAEQLPPGWTWVITRDAATRVAAPPRWELEPRVSALVEAIRARDGSERGPDAALASDLVAEALAALPASVTHVFVVPDGPVHQVPLEALPLPDGRRLGARLTTSVVPSLRALAALRALSAAPPGRVRVGVFGDLDVVQLGAEATEAALVVALTDPSAGLVHVAAPLDRHLTAAELGQLRVPGTVVVLSACETAAGQELAGEGPLGLARALVQAGARAVVATRWPLRDEDGVRFFEAFYDALGDGLDLGGAVARARSEREAAGAPAEAWAGVVVVGDPRWVPVPGGRPVRWPWALALGSAAIGVGLNVWRRRTSG
jgi:hypothetical protein